METDANEMDPEMMEPEETEAPVSAARIPATEMSLYPEDPQSPEEAVAKETTGLKRAALERLRQETEGPV